MKHAEGSEKADGGRKFGLSVEQPAQIQKAPINITASKYLLESCYMHLIDYLGTSTKVPTFCRFLLEKLKIQ